MQGNKNVPELRFPEFEGEWITYKLCDVVTRIIRKNKNLETKRPLTISAKYGLIDQIEFFDKYVASKNLKGYYLLKKGEFAYNKSYSNGFPYGAVKRLDLYNQGAISTLYICFEITNKINSNFLKIYFDSNKWNKEMYKIAVEGARNHGLLNIPINDFFNTKHLFPSISEQEKIADFLSAIDKKIGFMEKIVENFLSYHKYIIQHLPLDPHNLIKKEGWQLLYLNEILFEHKLKSNGFEEVFSVSVEKGLINQIEHLGRSFSAKNTDKYNLVKYGDIVYTKSPTGDFPLGIIKQSHVKNNVIVSPLYGIFTPKTFELGYILENYFKYPVNCHNYLHSIVQKGAKNTMNITNKTFLSKQLYLPTNINEQKRIFNILYSLNRKIDLISDEIKEMREFKKGLLQKMFC